MRAAVLHQHGGPEALVFEPDWREPPLTEGEVKLRVRACSLNYHDVFTRRGMPGIKVPLPVIIGIDFVGDILELGPGVEGWSVGERVLVDPIDRVKGGLIGEMRDGGLAERTTVPAHTLVRVPPEVSDEAAAALPVAWGTAYRMMITRGEVKAGETVLILGASGGVGTCCVQLAKMAGATVAVCASSAEKLDRLKAMGADHLINYAERDFMSQVHEIFGKPRITGKGGVDVVINYTGGDTWVPALRCLRKGGRMLTCGATAGFDPKTDIRYIWTFEQDIKGSNGWQRADVEALLRLVADGRLNPPIDRILPLEKANEAVSLLEDRGVFGKVIVRP